MLVRQIRLAAYLKGDNPFLLEVPAGALEDGEDPVAAVCRKALEEAGCYIEKPCKLFSAYMSPGAVLEKVHFFSSTVSGTDEVERGGGVA